MPVYEKAKAEVLRRVAKVMKDYHGELAEHEVTLDVLMVRPTTDDNGVGTGPPLKKNGYPCAAIIKINSLRDRTNGLSDALLQIDDDRWRELSEAKQNALVDLRDRTNGLSDALLQIDDDRWRELSEAKQNALVDHELTHLLLAKDKDDQVKIDDLGRPKLKIKPHDREVGWFDDVVRRHNDAALEFVGFNQIWQQCQQMKLPFMQEVG